MKPWKVSDVMTSPAIWIAPETPYKEIARLLVEHAVSSLPVVDAAGRVVGLVSEADLLPKADHEAVATGYLFEGSKHRREAHKHDALTAGELMTSPATTLLGDATVAQAAHILYRRGMRRLPVVDAEHRLVGILSRRDLLRVFLRSDEEIAAEVRQLSPAETVTVSVEEGVVRLAGTLRLQSQVDRLRALAAAVTGVVAVEADLACDIDDRALDLPYRMVT